MSSRQRAWSGSDYRGFVGLAVADFFVAFVADLLVALLALPLDLRAFVPAVDFTVDFFFAAECFFAVVDFFVVVAPLLAPLADVTRLECFVR